MIIGHKKQWEFLQKSLQKNRISQTYLFTGPKSVGKSTVAKMFAEKLTASLSVSSAKHFPQKREENKRLNTDLLILSPEIIEKKGVKKEKKISVEEVREMQKELRLFPNAGKYRVLIIDDAHKLSKSAQNAILKILEEPNKSSIIILVSAEEGGLLPTVKSRLQKINFSLVSLREISEFVSFEKNDDLAQKIAIYSMGRPGLAKQMIEDKEFFQKRENLAKTFDDLLKYDINEKMVLAEKYSKNQLETIVALEFWIWLLRIDVYKNIKNDEKVRNNYKLIKILESGLEKIKNPSLNHRLILENMFLRI